MCRHDEESDKYVSKYLTHFVGKGMAPSDQFKLLCTVIKECCLRAKGNQDHADGTVEVAPKAPFSSDKQLLAYVVCFCDIPLSPCILKIHTDKYGQFGLAFSKKCLARKGSNPVLYLARGSGCTDHLEDKGRVTTREDFFDRAASEWLQEALPRFGQWPRRDNLVFWYLLCYCKFFDEDLGDRDPDNYYMEREWRAVGKVEFSHEDIEHVVLPADYKKKFAREFPDLEESIFPL